MSLKKQITIFLCACLAFAGLYAAFNALVDPFGIFGDVIFDYYEYDMTQNPRLAKIAYFDRHHDEYDSYIFGCSKASSYPVADLNEYLDASFYNMFTYGGDLHDIEQMAEYVLSVCDDGECKNLVLAIGPEAAYRYDSEDDAYKDNMHAKVDDRVDPISFYAKYLFLNPSYAADKISSYFGRGYLPDSSNVFIAETGAYNKLRRDSLPISDIDTYLSDMADSEFDITYQRPLDYIDEAVASVEAIKALCDEKNINFTLIGSPLSDAELECYDKDELTLFAEKLCEVTDFCCFWGYNAISHDVRYFYDGYHFRNSVGSSVLSYVFGGDGYVPEDFGRLLTRENVKEELSAALDKTRTSESTSTKLPILMYHALTEDEAEASDTVITLEAFEEQIKALAEDGYTAIFYRDLLEYVECGLDLPEKSILISFDDGYESNITLAAPILERYGMCGTVSVIGVSVGKDTYKDTGVSMYPHFDYDEAKTLYESGVLDIQSHTYDMHNNSLDTDFRDGVLMKDGESEDAYINALETDFARSKSEIESGVGNEVFVITYPFGKREELTDIVLGEAGARISVTVEEGVNEIIKGLPQSLRCLKRINMTSDIGGDELLRRITAYIYD